MKIIQYLYKKYYFYYYGKKVMTYTMVKKSPFTIQLKDI